jgi:hypothetical protein
MKRKLDFYAANGVRGIFYCGVPQNFRSLFVFVQSRLLWEPKADVEAAIQEFMNAYYGKAAPYVRQYFDLMYHEVETRPVHQMCEGPNPGLLTAELAGKALDLFRQAEAAVEEDRAALYRVRREKLCVLFADLNERNLANGKLTISRDEFAQRAAEFMKIGRDLKVGAIIRRQKTGAEWLQRIARIRLQAKPWYADPLVGRMIADPAKTLAEAGQQFCQKAIPGGLLLELDGFTGCRGPEEYGYECPPKRAVWIYGKNTKNPKMFIGFHLAKTPETPARLALLAQDDDKPGAVEISIALNGSEIFRGPNPFAERGWSTAEFPIPAGVLKQGENELCIATLKDSPAADAGWFMVAECKVAWK